MSAYILPNSILLLAIVLAIVIIARHFPEATRQLEESGGGNAETVGDVLKRWLPKARGGIRAFWRFVLEGKGLRDPRGSKFRMRQLLEQNRLPRKAAVKPKIINAHAVQPVIASVLSVQQESQGNIELPEVKTEAVEDTGNPVVSVSEPLAAVAVPAPKPPKSASRRKPAVVVHPDEVMRQAKVFIDNKEFLRARHELEQVTSSFQDNPVYWARLGYVQYHLGAYMEAIRCYQKSLALDSNQANRYYNLALAYEAAQEHSESLAALDKALALDPGNVKYEQTRDALKTM